MVLTSTDSAVSNDVNDKIPSAIEKAKDFAIGLLVKVAQVVDDNLPQILHAFGVLKCYINFCMTKWNEISNEDINQVVLGLFFCFYGGSFPALIATVTAIQQSGQWPTLKNGLTKVYYQLAEAWKVLKEDEIVKALDTNADGRVSLEEIALGFKKSGKGLIMSAAPLMMKKVDPCVMNEAITSIWVIWCSVLITLKSMFARQVALGMKLGQQVSGSVKHRITPIIADKVDKEYKVWADYGVLVGCKVVGVFVAMFLSRLIGGFSYAIQGGEMVAKVIILMAQEKGLVKSDEVKNFQGMGTYLIGGLGFFYQLLSGFSMNIILQVILFPAVLFEVVIGFLVYIG